MRVDIVFTPDVFVNQEILALVAEDDMNFLGARAANVRSYKIRYCLGELQVWYIQYNKLKVVY